MITIIIATVTIATMMIIISSGGMSKCWPSYRR
jgi:hypothetical protein